MPDAADPREIQLQSMIRTASSNTHKLAERADEAEAIARSFRLHAQESASTLLALTAMYLDTYCEMKGK